MTEGETVREYETAHDPLPSAAADGRLQSREAGEREGLSRAFHGGAVGYLSYDMVRYFEPTIGAATKDELQLPESLFMIAETVLIFDHRTRGLRILSNAEVRDGNTDAAYAEAERAFARSSSG